MPSIWDNGPSKYSVEPKSEILCQFKMDNGLEGIVKYVSMNGGTISIEIEGIMVSAVCPTHTREERDPKAWADFKGPAKYCGIKGLSDFRNAVLLLIGYRHERIAVENAELDILQRCLSKTTNLYSEHI